MMLDYTFGEAAKGWEAAGVPNATEYTISSISRLATFSPPQTANIRPGSKNQVFGSNIGPGAKPGRGSGTHDTTGPPPRMTSNFIAASGGLWYAGLSPYLSLNFPVANPISSVMTLVLTT